MCAQPINLTGGNPVCLRFSQSTVVSLELIGVDDKECFITDILDKFIFIICIVIKYTVSYLKRGDLL